MQDKKMKQLKIILILLVILLLGLILFMIFNKNQENPIYQDEQYATSSKNEVVEHRYEASVINKHYNALSEDDKSNIDEIIDTVVKEINDKDYEALYALLTDDYKRAYYPTLEALQAYVDQVFAKECYGNSYKITNNGCLIDLKFQESDNTQKVLIKNYRDNRRNLSIIL